MSRGAWQTIGVVEVDGGTVAFADPMHLPATVPMAISPEGWRPMHDSNVPRQLVAVGTGGDMPVPVEVRRDDDGRITETQMAFVDDLGDLDGQWIEIGRMRIGASGCVALDPSVPLPKATRVRFELRPGVYSAEVFEWSEDADTLALRIRFLRED